MCIPPEDRNVYELIPYKAIYINFSFHQKYYIITVIVKANVFLL